MSLEAWGDEFPEEGRFDAAIDAGWIDPTDVSKAMIDVMAERDRQWNEEGWTPSHDDAHDRGELAIAAACYAAHGVKSPFDVSLDGPALWPFDMAWWKPGDRRRDLVKAGALILAEIERLDRLAARK